jgi:hypothetical protein
MGSAVSAQCILSTWNALRMWSRDAVLVLAAIQLALLLQRSITDYLTLTQPRISPVAPEALNFKRNSAYITRISGKPCDAHFPLTISVDMVRLP